MKKKYLLLIFLFSICCITLFGQNYVVETELLKQFNIHLVYEQKYKTNNYFFICGRDIEVGYKYFFTLDLNTYEMKKSSEFTRCLGFYKDDFFIRRRESGIGDKYFTLNPVDLSIRQIDIAADLKDLGWTRGALFPYQNDVYFTQTNWDSDWTTVEVRKIDLKNKESEILHIQMDLIAISPDKMHLLF